MNILICGLLMYLVGMIVGYFIACKEFNIEKKCRNCYFYAITDWLKDPCLSCHDRNKWKPI
jgi:hypothetical protein